MNTRRLLAASLVLGLSSGLFAWPGTGSDSCPHQPRKELRSDAKRPAPTPEQAAFLETRRTLHDSLGQAMRTYSKAVRDGAAPRTLVTERGRIADLSAKLDRHRTENLETWLDVAAYRPDRPGKAKHMKNRRDAKRNRVSMGDSTATP